MLRPYEEAAGRSRSSAFGHGAELAFGETFGGYGEGAVEAGARIFPADDGREFHKLALGELLAQGRIEVIGHIGGRVSEDSGEAKHDFFLLVEVRAGFKLRNVLKLLLGDSGFSADGRVDVNSKRTADHEGCFELRELFQVHGDDTLCRRVEIHADGVAEIFRIEGANAHAERHVAERAFGEEVKDPGDETGIWSAL